MFSLSIVVDGKVVPTTNEGYCVVPDGAEYAVRITNRGKERADCTISIDGESVGTWRLDAGQGADIERPADNSKARKFTFVKERGAVAAAAGVEAGLKDNGLVTVVCKPEDARVRAEREEAARRAAAAVVASQVQLSYAVGMRTMSCRDAHPPRRAGVQRDRADLGPTMSCRSDGGGSMGGFSFGGELSSGGFDFDRSAGGFQPFAAPSRRVPECVSRETHESGATVLGAESKQTFRDADPIVKYDTDAEEAHHVRLVVAKDQPPVSLRRAMQAPAAAPPPPRLD